MRYLSTPWRARGRGFTLVEILVVIAIVAVLAALMWPVLAGAKTAAKRAACMSNLRQCATAMLVYLGDLGDDFNRLPTYEQARAVLAGAPTDDPGDSWRRSSHEDLGAPLIGSYAYLRGAFAFHDQDRWAARTGPNGREYPLFLCVFYTEPRIPRFDGETCVPADKCSFPTGIVRVRMDGSVQVTKDKPRLASGSLLFSWSGAFQLEDGQQWVRMDKR